MSFFLSYLRLIFRKPKKAYNLVIIIVIECRRSERPLLGKENYHQLLNHLVHQKNWLNLFIDRNFARRHDKLHKLNDSNPIEDKKIRKDQLLKFSLVTVSGYAWYEHRTLQARSHCLQVNRIITKVVYNPETSGVCCLQCKKMFDRDLNAAKDINVTNKECPKTLVKTNITKMYVCNHEASGLWQSMYIMSRRRTFCTRNICLYLCSLFVLSTSDVTLCRCAVCHGWS